MALVAVPLVHTDQCSETKGLTLGFCETCQPEVTTCHLVDQLFLSVTKEEVCLGTD